MSVRSGGFETRLISAGHSDHMLALHRCLNVEQPKRCSGPAPKVAALLANAGRQALSLDLLVGAYSGNCLLGACLAVESPGRVAMVSASSPTSDANARGATMAALGALQEAAWKRSITLLEVLIDPNARKLAAAVEAAGFNYLTRLRHLRRPATGVPSSSRPANDLRWSSFRPDLEPLFRATLESTYVQSLDCPELMGLRSTADVLAGHRATGVYDPAHWWVATRGEVGVGILLLNRIPSEGATEIVYLGVAQPARGTKVADALLERAVTSARQVGATWLTLAVDERNTPALKTYARWNFAMTGLHDAWIASPLRT